MMDNPAETGILSGDPFSHQYEVNSNEKVYSEGTTGKVETGGEMEKAPGETRDSDGGSVVEADGFRSDGMEDKVGTDTGNGLGAGEVHGGDGHGGDEDVVMADVDAEDGYVGGGDVHEECIGLDQAQPAVLENGKQNGRPCDPFASPDDQPMPPAESPAVQNIYDLQSSWPQQPLADNGDTYRQPDEYLNQEETIPTQAIVDDHDDKRGQVCPEETLDSYSHQNLQEDEIDKVDKTGSESYFEQEVVDKEKDIPQDHIDSYNIERADHVEQKGFETEKDTPQEILNLNLQEAALGTALATKVAEDHLQQEHLGPQESATDDNVEQNVQKEKESQEEHLDVQEAVTVEHIEQKYIVTEKETIQDNLEPSEAPTADNFKQEYNEREVDLPKGYIDSFEGTQDNSEQMNIEFEKQTSQGLEDPYETTEADSLQQNDIEVEKDIPKAYQDPYGITETDQQVTTTMQQEPIKTSGEPYSSEEILVGLSEKEEVQPAEVYQEYTQGITEPAAMEESEVYVEQEELRKSEEIAQECHSERVESVGKVETDDVEDIPQLNEVEPPCESMDIEKDSDSEGKDMEQIEGASHIAQENVPLIEASSMQKPIHIEEGNEKTEDEKEDLRLDNQVQGEELEPEQLLDPYAPENADMAETGDTLHPEDSEQLEDQSAQQGNIPQEYSDAHLIRAEEGTKEIGSEVTAVASSEDRDLADEQQMHEDDYELSQTLDDQAESGNMQLEMPIDPIDAVFKANSQENILGLDPETAVHETKQDEAVPENLEPVLESDQNVTMSELLKQTDEATQLIAETQPEVAHDSMNIPLHGGEDANIDLSNAQDSVVSAEVDTESFQSGSAIESSDPLVSQGLSEVDIEPSQQSADLSIPTVPDVVQESDNYDGGECQEERVEPDKSEEQQVEPSRSEAEYEAAASESTLQAKASSLPLLDLGDGPVQSMSIADQSPGQRSFEGSFSPIEDNVAVSLALEDQAHVVESGDREESDDDANTETTEVEAEVQEDNFERKIQYEEESTYNTLKEVPTEAGGHEGKPQDKTLDDGKDTSEVPQSEMADTNIDESSFGFVQDQAEISPEIPDTMQTQVETYLEEEEKGGEEYKQVQPELLEDSMAGVEVAGVEESANFSVTAAAIAEASQEVSTEPCVQDTPDIIMQEYSEEMETEPPSYITPAVSTDTTLQDTADKLLGEPEEADALIMERSRASATPPNTPEVISASPPEMASAPQPALIQETMQREREAINDELAPEAEQCAPCDYQTVQSEEKKEPFVEEPARHEAEEKKEPFVEEPARHEAEEVVESAPEEPPPDAPICEEKAPSPEVTKPSIPLAVHTPEVPKATSAPVAAKEKEIKSSPARQKMPKASTDIRSPSKKMSPSASQKDKSIGKPKGSDTPKKTAALSKSQPKASAPVDRKEAAKAPSRSPAKTPSKMPLKTPAKVPAAKTPTKASPKVQAPAPARPTSSAKKTPGQASAGATPTRPKTTPSKVDTKPSDSKPKQDKVKMSGVKQKTVTTVTKTTHTEVKSAKSSPRKSADGDSPRVRHSPGRNGVSSKIGSLDNSRHSPGGGSVKIQSEKSNYSKVQSRCGSLGNTAHKAGGGNVKILNQSTDYSKTVKSKIGSLDNATHSPGGGKVKIENKKVDFSKKVTSKIGSLDNATHKPGGGKVKIEKKKLDFKEKAASKIGSKDNIKHQAGGGQVKIENKKLDFKEKATSKVGSKDNIEHKAGGGQVKIQEEKLEFKAKASSKIGSLDNAHHKPGGGDVQILDEKINFSSTAQSKVGSLDNADHQPSGGDVKIFDEKPTFQHASPRTDDGIH